MSTEIRVAIRNTSETGGTAFTPVFTAFHDGSFDIYDLGAAASPGLEALAEDGNNGVIAGELTDADADAQSVNVVGARGPIDTRELADTTIMVDGASNGYVSLASMVLPSNDAFFGTADAVALFDDEGAFLGAQTITFDGGSVRDAGTEVNTEMDAAFINQTGPNTGETEGGVVTVHPGFNGSLGNPGGDQIILGGTNAFGNEIDPVAADFTQPGAEVATVHINVVERETGTRGRDVILGSEADDIVEAQGGNDIVVGGAGWDVLNGGAGRDIVSGGSGDDIINGGTGQDLLLGGSGGDDIYGGAGRDKIFGNSGNDNLSGDRGNDRIFGGEGNDLISGGAGRDVIDGGEGDDIFLFATGSDVDVIQDFDSSGDDRIALDVDGVESFDDVLDRATERGGSTVLNFDNGDRLILRDTDIADLSADDFLFG